MLAIIPIIATVSAQSSSFEPSCASSVDYGWPRFQNLTELQADKRWSTYFKLVFGEVPSTFPVCTFDFWVLNETAYEKAGLSNTRTIISNPKTVKEGDLFRQNENLQIYHGKWEPAPNHSWVEVQHMVFPTEVDGMWVWRTRGSGVYANVGRTVVFPTPADTSQAHHDAIAFLSAGCSKKPAASWPQYESDVFGFCAREKGYDSIQFEPQQGTQPMGSFGLTGLTEMVLVNLVGKYNSGVLNASQTPLRSGWQASHQCQCDNEAIMPSCGLMPKPPFPYSLIGESPRLCRLREKSRFAKCNPTTCRPTLCRV